MRIRQSGRIEEKKQNLTTDNQTNANLTSDPGFAIVSQNHRCSALVQVGCFVPQRIR